MKGCSHGRFGRRAQVALITLLSLVYGAAVLCISPAEARHRVRRHHPVVLKTDPNKDAALVVDGISGKVLYARNADASRHPASLTKMMTLYLLFDALKRGQVTMDTTLTFSRHAATQKPTNMRLWTGAKMSVGTAINALIVRSANDVAAAVAEELGGTESHFAAIMTAKARALGMRHTIYRNASGLPDNLQITTARDLALLARHLAYDFPEYFHYFSNSSFVYRGRRYPGHDNLLGKYRGADGMKTGYTYASGFNLVTSVSRGNSHVVGVIMGGPSARQRDREMMKLLDSIFDRISEKPSLIAHAELPWRMDGITQVSQRGLWRIGEHGEMSPYLRARLLSPAVRSADDTVGATYANLPTPVPAPEPPVTRTALADTPAASVMPRPAPQKDVRRVAAYEPLPVPRRRNSGIYLPVPAPRDSVAPSADTSSVTKRKTTGIHDWTIQIGAFADLADARAKLATYAERSKDVLSKAQRMVVPYRGINGQWLYRARFGPFVESEARQICATMTERGQTCFAAIATR